MFVWKIRVRGERLDTEFRCETFLGIICTLYSSLSLRLKRITFTRVIRPFSRNNNVRRCFRTYDVLVRFSFSTKLTVSFIICLSFPALTKKKKTRIPTNKIFPRPFLDCPSVSGLLFVRFPRHGEFSSNEHEFRSPLDVSNRMSSTNTIIYFRRSTGSGTR